MLNVRCNPTKNSTKIITTLKMDKEFKNCQSCGMPLKRDEKGGGTNADTRILPEKNVGRWAFKICFLALY